MYLGALRAMEEHFKDDDDRNFATVLDQAEGFAGTSIGSLTALALCLGLSSTDLHTILTPVLQCMHSIAPHIDFSLLVRKYGVDDGDVIRELVRKVLVKAGLSDTTTLAELKRLTRRSFVCVTTDLTHRTVRYLSAKETPDTMICDAIFMSMCVPLLFAPASIDDALCADGALMMDIPMCFPSDKTLFFVIDSYAPTNVASIIRDWSDYVEALVACALQQQRQANTAYLSSALCCISLTLPKCVDKKLFSAFQWNMLPHEAKLLIRAGYLSALAHLCPGLTETTGEIARLLVRHHASQRDEAMQEGDVEEM